MGTKHERDQVVSCENFSPIFDSPLSSKFVCPFIIKDGFVFVINQREESQLIYCSSVIRTHDPCLQKLEQRVSSSCKVRFQNILEQIMQAIRSIGLKNMELSSSKKDYVQMHTQLKNYIQKNQVSDGRKARPSQLATFAWYLRVHRAHKDGAIY